MHSLHNRGVHSENLRILPNYAPNKMDYRQKMVVPDTQNFRREDEDDDDLEALRLAALKSLRVKPTVKTSEQKVLLQQSGRAEATRYPGSYPGYCQQRTTKRGYYQNRLPRHNGNLYYPSRVNHNLIEIIPVQQDKGQQKEAPQHDQKTAKEDAGRKKDADGDSKFCRYSDDASDSEEEDTKESNSTSAAAVTSKSERLEKGEPEGDDSGTERDVQSGFEESPREESASESSKDENEVEEGQLEEEEDEEEEDEEKPTHDDDDDDILLMSDVEEQNSLDRLMDEMEREMKPGEKDVKSSGKDGKEAGKPKDVQKQHSKVSRTEQQRSERNGLTCATAPVSTSSVPPKSLDVARPPSPRPTNRPQQIHRSLSPKPRSRKRSPRRSPRRSPTRQIRKLSRESQRPRSPRKSPPSIRFSPRLSPRRSPNRSPVRRSPPARGRSPHSRSPRIRRSRSPRPISRSGSPRSLRSPKRTNRSRSPRIVRSRSPRLSPPRVSPRSRSPLRARSPCRIAIRSRSQPRNRSPRRSKSPRISPNDRLSPPRRASPRRAQPSRPRSPKMSPERRRTSPARIRSPGRLSPRRSPWDSPRNSPRASPRRRRSPKDSSRKNRAITPIEKSSASYKREPSLSRKTATSPDPVRSKTKQPPSRAAAKDASATSSSDPILEARKRKFESNKLIDPVNDNKKIKLSKKETSSKREEVAEPQEAAESPKRQKSSCEDLVSEYAHAESDLCLTDDYVYEVLEDVASDNSSANNDVAVCVEMVPVKAEKVRSKKKRKRDKELYQVGKSRGELPLSERIGKEKRCKKRKDKNSSAVESSPESAATTNAVEDLTVDEEGDLRTELSRRRAERLSRAAPVQSARLLQSAFKGVVKEVAKTNAKVIQRHAPKGEEKNNKKEVRRVTVLPRQVTDLPDSEEETVVDSKVPVRFRLGLNKPSSQESRETKAARKSSKRPGRKVKHKNNLSLTDHERKKQ